MKGTWVILQVFLKFFRNILSRWSYPKSLRWPEHQQCFLLSDVGSTRTIVCESLIRAAIVELLMAKSIFFDIHQED